VVYHGGFIVGKKSRGTSARKCGGWGSPEGKRIGKNLVPPRFTEGKKTKQPIKSIGSKGHVNEGLSRVV